MIPALLDEVKSWRMRRKRRLSVEALEWRIALTTTAMAPNGILGIVGDHANQHITVTQTGTASFRVDGLTAGSQTFHHVRSISVNTKDGDDRVVFAGAGRTANLSSVSVTGFLVQTGAGNDSIFVGPGVFIQGRTLINLGDGTGRRTRVE